MKIFIPIFLLLFFSSCSNKNAFSEFEMDENQQLSTTSLKRTIITENKNVIGAFNAIYLNDVYPDIYNTHEYFFVYIYLKENENISNPNTVNKDKLNIFLNNKPPVKLKKLNSKNRFYKLSASKNDWNRYYLVSFATQGKKLTLKLENGQSFSVELKYQKD